jgi:hypothetical protein
LKGSAPETIDSNASWDFSPKGEAVVNHVHSICLLLVVVGGSFLLTFDYLLERGWVSHEVNGTLSSNDLFSANFENPPFSSSRWYSFQEENLEVIEHILGHYTYKLTNDQQ